MEDNDTFDYYEPEVKEKFSVLEQTMFLTDDYTKTLVGP
jgi:hypothetical protein